MPTYVEPVFRPPSEARSLIFQITVGCSQNHCTFCGMYKMKQFRLRPAAEIFVDIEEIPPRYRPFVDRVFLADGDALVYPQAGLTAILDRLAAVFPNLTRVGAYASPRSLTTKSIDDLRELRQRRLRILYFGLESGDDETLRRVGKGFTGGEMADLALAARESGMKLSVTAILGLAGATRSLEHARATAAWINRVNPEFFSLLTLFHRHNDDFIRQLDQCTRRQLLSEARELLLNLSPQKCILRSNHVSNFLLLAGSYPKDRERLIGDINDTLARLGTNPEYLDEVPAYGEEYY